MAGETNCHSFSQFYSNNKNDIIYKILFIYFAFYTHFLFPGQQAACSLKCGEWLLKQDSFQILIACLAYSALKCTSMHMKHKTRKCFKG